MSIDLTGISVEYLFLKTYSDIVNESQKTKTERCPSRTEYTNIMENIVSGCVSRITPPSRRHYSQLGRNLSPTGAFGQCLETFSLSPLRAGRSRKEHEHGLGKGQEKLLNILQCTRQCLPTRNYPV
jgi:hypothetical protein